MKSIKPLLYIIAALTVVSCENNSFDSEVLPISETVYISRLESPSWSEDQMFWSIDLSPRYNLDSLTNDLNFLRRTEASVLVLRNIQQVRKDSVMNQGLVDVVLNFDAPDSLIGKGNDLKNFILSANNKGLKVIMEWNTAWTIKNPRINDIDSLVVVNWDGNAFKVDDSEGNRQKLFKNAEYWIKEIGFNGMICNDPDQFEMSFWEELRNEVIQDNEILLIGNTANAEFLNMTFNFISDRFPLSVPKEKKGQVSFQDRKEISFFKINRKSPFLTCLESAMYNHNSYVLDWLSLKKLNKENLKRDIIALTDWRREQKDLFKMNGHYDFKWDKVNRSSFEMNREKSNKGTLLVINFRDSIVSFEKVSAYTFSDFKSDSVLAPFFDIPPLSYKLLNFEK